MSAAPKVTRITKSAYNMYDSSISWFSARPSISAAPKVTITESDNRVKLVTTCMTEYNNITSIYGSSCANNGKDALNTPVYDRIQ
eukprot:1060639-Pyramimonas_sp.AAC.1